jgi:hypothetical protein
LPDLFVPVRLLTLQRDWAALGEVADPAVESMARAAAEIGRLLALSFASIDVELKSTSVRLPAGLHEACTRAVEAGWAGSVSEILIHGAAGALARQVEHVSDRVALEAAYAENPEARPALWEVALAAVQQDGSPLADHPDLLRAAAEAVCGRNPDATVDDVLMWAEGALSHAAQ